MSKEKFNYDKIENEKINVTRKTERAYSYYSNILQKPFDSIEELEMAEDTYYAKLKAKEDKVNEKKADAKRVEEAFKALNTARRAYKDSLVVIVDRYNKDLKELKANFEKDRTTAQNLLANAEEAYRDILKAFTDKYPEGYHLTLKDGDFETTISNKTTTNTIKPAEFATISDMFDFIFSRK